MYHCLSLSNLPFVAELHDSQRQSRYGMMSVFTSNFFVSVIRNGSACSMIVTFAVTLPAVSLICLFQFSKGSKCTPRYLYVSVVFSISPVIFSPKLESSLKLPFASKYHIF